MKNIFFMLITALLFVFVSTVPSFANEADYDPVKVENVIYCDCYAVAPIQEVETEKYFSEQAAIPIRQNYFLVYTGNGLHRSRDNIENQKENTYSRATSATATDAKRDRKINNILHVEKDNK